MHKNEPFLGITSSSFIQKRSKGTHLKALLQLFHMRVSLIFCHRGQGCQKSAPMGPHWVHNIFNNSIKYGSISDFRPSFVNGIVSSLKWCAI